MDIDITKQFSHPGKLLEEHLQGVADKVLKRIKDLPTTLNFKTSEIAAIFHDLGKINPNFQEKLKPPDERKNKNLGYSSHAYLSAYIWFCFMLTNREILAEWFGKNTLLNVHNVMAMLARHHGNLPNFEDGILNKTEADRLTDFLKSYSDLPISDFLKQIKDFENHKIFSLEQDTTTIDKILKSSLSEYQIKELTNPIEFFLETQFGFACLLESDKRDAGGNTLYKRDDLKPYFQAKFDKNLDDKFKNFKSDTDLNKVRTEMREECVQNIQEQLPLGKRVFALSAPTGAGKTMMLLALANEILKENNGLSVIYALPFLSITEQVEAECQKIFADIKQFDNGKFENESAVMRIDSRSENERIQKLQKELEDDQHKEKLLELIRENFSEVTFDHPFIVTTFVQVFEALVSNRNATLLRLPNFANSVFLIDEIQALPPRLYTFLIAFLDEFCSQFNSYAIISTATMPYLEIAQKDSLKENERCEKLFVNYEKPPELLSANNYFNAQVFNRYQIFKDSAVIDVEEVAERIKKSDESCLVILNTIDDTKELYAHLIENYETDECILLNTHFTLKDRREKLNHCKRRLSNNQKIILISTQLIEAGVDIDFPVLYRDLCPLPNLIQSAGRCNREGNLPNGELGKVHFITLQKENGKISAELIYRGKDKILLNFERNNFPSEITENQMKELQENYFEFVGKNLSIGVHEQNNGELNMIRHINKAEFEKLGRFRLIEKIEFGEEYRYFIPQGDDDNRFERLQELAFVKKENSFAEAKRKRIEIETKLREMSDDIVQFRLKKDFNRPSATLEDEVLGIYKLADEVDYSSEKGILLEAGGYII
ncbi:MAG: CRISPR-associated helicase Cas3' [Aridibacter sp.]